MRNGYRLYNLTNDSLNIPSLSITLHYVRYGASHGTEYIIIDDYDEEQCYFYSRSNGHFNYYLPLEIQRNLLDPGMFHWKYLQPVGTHGLSYYLNNSKVIRTKGISRDELDLILTFKNEFQPIRLKSPEQIDEAINTDIKFFERADLDMEEEKTLLKIAELLKKQLPNEDVLLLGYKGQHIDYYEMNRGWNLAYFSRSDSTINKENFSQRVDLGMPTFKLFRLRIGIN
ncbi:MAG: hypothetical protein WD077_02035 [Bacteroidia bacterium]